ncbi:MAG: GNAT family N-acetyltransferase [Candidatus Bathyarchaeia archaeon]
MHEEVVCSRILGDGEELTVKVATPPLSERLIKVFLRTPELSATKRESGMRLFGAIHDQSSDYFLAGELDGKIVGTLWYCTPATCKEIAYMGEAFTNKKQRRKGVATSLLEVAVDFFRENGGRAIYITNLCPNAPHRIYRKLGFQAYGYGLVTYGGIIRLTVNERSEDFDRAYYEHDSNTSIRNVNWGDLPHFIALLNYPHPWILRAYNFGLIGPGVFDELGRSFMNFMKTLKEGNICLVLEDSEKRMVGTAYTSSLHTRSQSHVKTVDFLVHPNYFAEAAELLKALVEKLSDGKAGKLQAYAAAATDRSRTEILRLCGFKREATMQDQLRIGSKKIDLEIYSIILKR